MGYMIGAIVVSAAIGSIIWAAILIIWAKKVANLESVTYGRSYLVSFVGWHLFGVLYYIFGKIVMGKPEEFLKFFDKVGVIGVVVVFFALMVVAYTISGKLLWKVSWGEAAKGTAIVPLIVAILCGLGAAMVG